MINGPTFFGKNWYKMEQQKLVSNRVLFIITRKPGQYIDEIHSEEVIPEISKNDGRFVVLKAIQDVFEFYQKPVHSIFTRGRQRYRCLLFITILLDVPKTTIRKNSNMFFLLKKTSEVLENCNRVIARFDMSHDKINTFRRKIWKDEKNYFCFDRLKTKVRVKNVFVKKKQI